MLASDDLRRRMHQEHRTLRTLQEDMLERFESFCEEPNDGAHRAMAEVFLQFKDSVLRHFEFEEADGYMHIVVERRPHHQHRVGVLLKEHGTIIALLERLATELDSDIMKDVPRYATFKKDFVDLITIFGRHEQAERELVMETFWLEGGVSD